MGRAEFISPLALEERSPWLLRVPEARGSGDKANSTLSNLMVPRRFAARFTLSCLARYALSKPFAVSETPMNILVINCGSSSIKADVLDHHTGSPILELKVQRLGQPGQSQAQFGQEEPVACAPDHETALATLIPQIMTRLEAAGAKLDGVGHRVAQGGAHFGGPVRITQEVEDTIAQLIPLAPLHNPANLSGIRQARAALPHLPHIAVFDTAFHATLPRRAYTYALPMELATEHGIRRFGFHGTSHDYVTKLAAAHLEDEVRHLRIISCHLGNGCSVAAVEYGRSIETSMGMTPLEGLVMGTRSGDLDPGVVIHLAKDLGYTPQDLDRILNTESGLSGLSGVGNDLRDIEQRASQGDERCRLAIQVFCHVLRKYIGAYAAVMGGVDAIVFTGGIGQNSQVVRHRVAQRLDFLGARFDEERNRDASVTRQHPVAEIHNRRSRVALLVARTDESHAIATQAANLVASRDLTQGAERTIPVAVSARHLHLTQASVEALFGPGHTLTPHKPLSQPGQFACQEQVTLVGPKRSIEGVRVLGPVRGADQVEISRTDEFYLGIDAPVRASGDVANTPGITLIGTDDRRLELKQGVICAWRHIHMTPEDAAYFGVEDKDVVEVEVGHDTGRNLIFGDVLVRVKPSYALEMHIDTDEGNAAELGRDAQGSLRPTQGTAHLRKRGVRYDT